MRKVSVSRVKVQLIKFLCIHACVWDFGDVRRQLYEALDE